jgi:hypothetical protein
MISCKRSLREVSGLPTEELLVQYEPWGERRGIAHDRDGIGSAGSADWRTDTNDDVVTRSARSVSSVYQRAILV